MISIRHNLTFSISAPCCSRKPSILGQFDRCMLVIYGSAEYLPLWDLNISPTTEKQKAGISGQPRFQSNGISASGIVVILGYHRLTEMKEIVDIETSRVSDIAATSDYTRVRDSTLEMLKINTPDLTRTDMRQCRGLTTLYSRCPESTWE
jgi:hypothetical protein